MSGAENHPARQFTAAWHAATDALGQWQEKVAAATSEVVTKLDPAVRSAIQAGVAAVTGSWHICHCDCAAAHPDDNGVCDSKAVLNRRNGEVDVPLCAPCAVAQGVAELPR
jgi:hypothetical protein